MFKRKVRSSFGKISESGRLNFATVVSPEIALPSGRIFAGSSKFCRIFSFFLRSRFVATSLFFFASDGEAGALEFFENFVFKAVHVVLFGKGGNKRSAFLIFPSFRRFIPFGKDEGEIKFFSSGKGVLLKWARKKREFNVSLRFGKDGQNVNFSGNFSEKGEEMATFFCAKSSKSCSINRMVPLPLHVEEGDNRVLSLFCTSHFFAKKLSENIEIAAFGEIDGKPLVFHCETGSYDAEEANEYNNNFLSFGGKISALPAVCVTHPFGENGKWVVQDTENMVDISFSAQDSDEKMFDVLMIKKRVNSIFGTISGNLLTKSAYKLKLENVKAIVFKSDLHIRI